MRERALPPASEAALEVVGGLTPGTSLGAWAVVAVLDFHYGAVPVVLESQDGTRFQVDVLRHDDSPSSPQPLARSGALAFFLANRGDGGTPSAQREGLGVMALAAWVDARQGRSAGELLTFSERSARHSGAELGVPLRAT